MKILPLPHYDNFGENFQVEKKNVLAGVPRPTPPPPGRGGGTYVYWWYGDVPI